jgi:hypothetical protein
MALAEAHLLPSNAVYAPESVTARQNDLDVHDTEIIPSGPVPPAVDHRCPSKVRM